MEGWIKLHRKMLNNPVVFKDPDHVAVWLYLLLNATHKEYPSIFKGEKIILSPGQLITGRKAIANATGVDESKVRRIINRFKNDQQIDQEISNKNSLFTIINWNLYQDSDHLLDQQVANKEPTNNQQVTTYKNDNNVNNDNKENNLFESLRIEQSEQCKNKIIIPLIDGTFYEVPEILIENWELAFPKVNVRQELHRMIAWCNINPEKRKSIDKIERFINNWLINRQNFDATNSKEGKRNDNKTWRTTEDFYRGYIQDGNCR